ncbi:MAG: hypothetical protein GY906_36430 [bacterium]|nr:hypothetical protein [bacterium]
MKPLTRHAALLSLGVALLLFVNPADAQSSNPDKWTFEIAPLSVWAVKLGGTMTMQGPRGPFVTDFAEAFDSSEAVFSVHFEAKSGAWILFGDVSRLDGSGRQPVADPPIEPAQVDFEQTLIELGAAYHIGSSTSFVFGTRYASVDPRTKLPCGIVLNPSHSWTDVFAGLMWRPHISERWVFLGRVDLGAGSSDLAINAAAIFDVKLGRAVALMFGYRYLDMDFEHRKFGFGYDASQRGPMAALRFFW